MNALRVRHPNDHRPAGWLAPLSLAGGSIGPYALSCSECDPFAGQIGRRSRSAVLSDPRCTTEDTENLMTQQ